MNARLTIAELDALHSDLSIEGQEFLRRWLRTDVLIHEDALPEYLEWRGWEFADKQQHEYERQERDIMAGKVTYTKAVDDYVDDVPAVDIDDDGPTPPDREGEWDDDAKAAQPVGIPTPAEMLAATPHDEWVHSIGELTVAECDDIIAAMRTLRNTTPEEPAVDADDEWAAAVNADVEPVGIPTPSLEESWLISVGKVAQDMADDLDMVPADMTRHYKPHVTITRPVARASEYDLEVSEWLKRDYVLSSETAVASNGSPLLVAFLVAREFYRR